MSVHPFLRVAFSCSRKINRDLESKVEFGAERETYGTYSRIASNFMEIISQII